MANGKTTGSITEKDFKMTDQEKQALSEKIGQETASKIQVLSNDVDRKAKAAADEAVANKGLITKEVFDAYKESAENLATAADGVAKAQGMAISQLLAGGTAQAKDMSVGAFLHKNQDKLKAIRKREAVGFEFMITADKDGNFRAQEIETKDDNAIVVKAVGPHATVDAVPGAGNTTATVASVFQSMSAAAILRSVSGGQINAAYRNTTWLFPALGVEQVGLENRVAFYLEEEPRVGGSAIVPEGQPKPYVQYGARLRSAEYRKRAVALEFTQEFQLDFNFLETYFLQQARVDLLNDVNADVYSRVLAAGTAYAAADATAFKNAYGGPLPAGTNDYDILVAMAVKVNKSTFGANANAALMSTDKAGVLSIAKDGQGQYLERPNYIQNMMFIDNPTVGVNDVMVGDFSQYKLQLRGGLIVRAGLNGNNLIENKMTYVVEQFYFDYMPPSRAAAIVKGQTFGAVRTLLTT